MNKEIVRGIIVCAAALVLAGCASPRQTSASGGQISARGVSPSKINLKLRLDTTSGYPKVYVSRTDFEAALGKKLTSDSGISVLDGQGCAFCSQNPPDATGKIQGQLYIYILPQNDKPGSGDLLVFDSARQTDLKRFAYVGVMLSLGTPDRHSDIVLVKMPNQ